MNGQVPEPGVTTEMSNFLPGVVHCPSALLAGLGIGLGAYGFLRIFVINGKRCPSEARIYGKTVIVTGGNTGIGKTTAIMLAQRGGRVILACRNLTKGAAAVEEVKKKSGNEDVILKNLDLASTASIRKFAQDIVNTEERVDILLLNAGVMMTPYQLTKDGFELQFGVNHLGHFLLTHLLLDKLKVSAPSRVVSISSKLHYLGTLNYQDMMWENG